MPTKCTMFINWSSNNGNDGVAEESAGWSESVVFNGAVGAARNAFETLCNRRANLLAKKTGIVAQRYQPIFPVGPASLRKRVFPAGTTLAQDVPGMSLVTRIHSNIDNHDREIALRGTPDARVDGGVYYPSSIYDAALAAYFAALGNTFGMMVQYDPGVTAAVDWISTTGAMQLSADLSIPIGSRVFLRRATNTTNQPVGGTYIVESRQLDDKHYTLRAWDQGEVNLNGTISLPNMVFRSFATLAELSFVARLRKVGRPFGLQRGRASKRR